MGSDISQKVIQHQTESAPLVLNLNIVFEKQDLGERSKRKFIFYPFSPFLLPMLMKENLFDRNKD